MQRSAKWGELLKEGGETVRKIGEVGEGWWVASGGHGGGGSRRRRRSLSSMHRRDSLWPEAKAEQVEVEELQSRKGEEKRERAKNCAACFSEIVTPLSREECKKRSTRRTTDRPGMDEDVNG